MSPRTEQVWWSTKLQMCLPHYNTLRYAAWWARRGEEHKFPSRMLLVTASIKSKQDICPTVTVFDLNRGNLIYHLHNWVISSLSPCFLSPRKSNCTNPIEHILSIRRTHIYIDVMFIHNLSSKLQRKIVRRILLIEQHLLHKKKKKITTLKITWWITKDSVTESHRIT